MSFTQDRPRLPPAPSGGFAGDHDRFYQRITSARVTVIHRTRHFDSFAFRRR